MAVLEDLGSAPIQGAEGGGQALTAPANQSAGDPGGGKVVNQDQESFVQAPPRTPRLTSVQHETIKSYITDIKAQV